MARAFLVAILVLGACATSLGDSSDAGPECDAGVGPLGTCKPPKKPCDQCADDADCRGATCAVAPNGCHQCFIGDSATDGGTSCSMSTCLRGDECCGGMQCVRPGDRLCGGACRPGSCASDSDCPAGTHCLVTDPCGCNGPFEECVADCPGTPCGEGESCNGGKCEPTPCPQFTCPALETCLGAGGDAHGCAPSPCTQDVDCPGGACVFGGCRLPGQCSFLPP